MDLVRFRTVPSGRVMATLTLVALPELFIIVSWRQKLTLTRVASFESAMMPLVGSAWKLWRIGSASDPLKRALACAGVRATTAVNSQRAVALGPMEVPLSVSVPVG